MKNKLYVVLGPTGIGKTKLLYDIFKDKNICEVISVDSRQIYKYMSIGTSAPESYIKEKIPHHLVEFLEPNQVYSAGQFVKDAEILIKEIQQRNKIPILCGGTGFYFKAFRTGMFYLDEEYSQIKKEEIRKYLNSLTEEERYNELKKIDPKSFSKDQTGKGILHPKDTYRIYRSLELYYLTGKTLRMHYNSFTEKNKWDYQGIFIIPDPDLWQENLKLRAKKMVHEGLIQEAIHIFKIYGNCFALKTPGYREIYELYIKYGEKILSEPFKKEIIQILYFSHKKYGKAQIKWFKKEKTISHVSYKKALEFLKNISDT